MYAVKFPDCCTARTASRTEDHTVFQRNILIGVLVATVDTSASVSVFLLMPAFFLHSYLRDPLTLITDAIEEELLAHLSIEDGSVHVEPDG